MLPRAPLPINEQCHDIGDGDGTDQDHIIAGPAINELIFARPSADRVIATLAKQVLEGAAATKQAIATLAAVKVDIPSTTCRQRVITILTIQIVIRCGARSFRLMGNSHQAVCTITAKKILIVPEAGKQRVIARLAMELHKIARASHQAIRTGTSEVVGRFKSTTDDRIVAR